ncbi:hypothetical protein C8R44DRAFT_742892 [Mycena epipterygia]|nr:hypothetical protein C8R44DRAFT_742892 [Mycena epipterygia]
MCHDQRAVLLEDHPQIYCGCYYSYNIETIVPQHSNANRFQVSSSLVQLYVLISRLAPQLTYCGLDMSRASRAHSAHRLPVWISDTNSPETVVRFILVRGYKFIRAGTGIRSEGGIQCIAFTLESGLGLISIYLMQKHRDYSVRNQSRTVTPCVQAPKLSSNDYGYKRFTFDPSSY